MASMTRVVRRGRNARREVGRVVAVMDDAHVIVAWGDEAFSDQAATQVEFVDELRAAS